MQRLQVCLPSTSSWHMIYTTAILIIHIIYSLKLFYSACRWPLLLAMRMQLHKKLWALSAPCGFECVLYLLMRGVQIVTRTHPVDNICKSCLCLSELVSIPPCPVWEKKTTHHGGCGSKSLEVGQMRRR